MKKILRWVVFVPVGAILVLFLVANRELVALSFDPISTETPALASPALPLWLWLALFLFIGFALGAVSMWMSGRELRIRAKADRLELKALKKSAAGPKSAPEDPSMTPYS